MSENDNIKLIKYIEKYPILWKNHNVSNIAKKDVIWLEISKKIGLDGN